MKSPSNHTSMAVPISMYQKKLKGVISSRSKQSSDRHSNTSAKKPKNGKDNLNHSTVIHDMRKFINLDEDKLETK